MAHQCEMPSRADVLAILMDYSFQLDDMKCAFGTYDILTLFGVEPNATLEEVNLHANLMINNLSAQRFDFYYGAVHGGRPINEAVEGITRIHHRITALLGFRKIAQRCLRQFQFWLLHFPDEDSRDNVVRDHISMLLLKERYERERAALLQDYYHA